jgi:hypothetical protein
MKHAAVRQATERLKRAREALARMEKTAASYAAFERAWSDFLLSCSGVYSKLEQGAKGCGMSEGWFGRKKHDRKRDELLRYLHQARNADEHGVGGTLLLYATIEAVRGKLHAIQFTTSDDDATFTPIGDKDADMKVRKHIGLKVVSDSRYGDVFLPPTEHLGQRLNEPTALDVARLGLSYLERLVGEACQLPSRS